MALVTMLINLKSGLGVSAQSAICACKQLRVLVLRTLLDDETIQSESSLLQRFLASLPELKALLFYKAC